MRKTSSYPPPFPIRRRRWKFWAVTVPLGLCLLVPLAVAGDLAGELLGKIPNMVQEKQE